jgi:DNA-binding MarR family transcriptional regulator
MVAIDTIICFGTIVRVTRTTPRGPSQSPDPTSAIIADFRATLSQWKCASSERLLRLGVSMAQLHILFSIQRAGEMTMSRLADLLNVSLSNATGLVDRLEERGYVERHRITTDRRIVLVRVTPAGEEMLREVDALSDDLLRSVLGRLSSQQLRGVAHAMTALREGLDAIVGSPTDRHPASTAAPRSATKIESRIQPTLHGRT